MFTSAFATVTVAFSFALPANAITLNVDNVGYHQNGSKTAIIQDIPVGTDLKINLYDPNYNRRIPGLKGKVVYEIKIHKSFRDRQTQGPGTENWLIDFSSFKKSGTFELQIKPAKAELIKQPITISEFLYWDTMLPSIRTFYLNRSGQKITDRATGIRRSVSHPEDGLVEDKLSGNVYFKDASGGWYNGNNYAKYVTTTGIALGQLLSLYENSPKTMNHLRMDYPLDEPGLGNLPDYLHELHHGLQWLHSMQRNDGAFYRKVAGKQRPGKVRPEHDGQPRYIYGITTQDTAIATATMAMAARSYTRKDPGYAVKCLLSAERGWKFLNSHKEYINVNVDDDSGSSEYINPNGDANYRFWAATELYITTGKPIYHQYVLKHAQDIAIEPYSWKNPAILAMTDYATIGKRPHPQLKSYISKNISRAARQLAKRIEKDPYSISLNGYSKGSNQQLLAHINLILSADRITGRTSYRTNASKALHYLFGLNPIGVTYVTGIASNSVKKPAHKMAYVMHKSIPGMLVSGANSQSHDGITPKNAGALSYADSVKATSSNQTEILYNANLVYTLGTLNSLYNHGD